MMMKCTTTQGSRRLAAARAQRGDGLLLGAGPAWYWTAKYKDVSWEASVSQLKVEATQALRDATDKALRTEREQQARVRALEANHVETEKSRTAVQRRNRRLATELGGLRDPKRRASRDDTVSESSTDPTRVTDAAAGDRLSNRASKFLLNRFERADTAAVVYADICYK